MRTFCIHRRSYVQPYNSDSRCRRDGLRPWWHHAGYAPVQSQRHQGQDRRQRPARSRRLQLVPIIQSFAQLERNYGKEGAEIIVDNTQDILFGGFAPNSSSAEVLSKALGSRTVLSGSVSRSKNDPSQSLQMIERPLLTPDELKSLPKGDFIVMKTGVHPMRTRLKLYFKWGIFFDAPYTVPDRGNRRVEYAQRGELEAAILRKYPSESRRPLRLRPKQEVSPDA